MRTFIDKYKNINRIFKENGIYAFCLLLRKAINILFNYLFFGKNIRIDSRASVIGKKYIHFKGEFVCGPYTKIKAYPEVNGKSYGAYIEFGENATINDCSHVAAIGRIIIGDNTHIGSKCLIIDHGHGKYSGMGQSSPLVDSRKRILTHKDVFIGRNCWIADSVAIMPGVTIGDGCIIGTNSVVIIDVPSYCIAVGNPVRIIKKYDFEKKEWVKCE